MNESKLAEMLGARPISRRHAAGGYTPADRWVVELADGRAVFVKAAVNDLTAGWLRDEHRLYEALRAPYMPRMLGWWDEDDRPMLLLEDLSGAFWPPPWSDERIEAGLRMLTEVAATTPPPWLPRLVESRLLETGWRFVAEDPAALLATRVVDAAWLDGALPTLLAASDTCRLDGDELCHFDARSDNMCFRADGSGVLVDWNLAAAGNGRLDVAFWLPSLHLEGGPMPNTILPDAGPEAAIVSGFFAARAGLPAIPDAPRVRPFQLAQLRDALPWACRALGLPLPTTLGGAAGPHGSARGRR